MYQFVWDSETGGFLLTTSASDYIANEIRPVYSEELELVGLDAYLEYDRKEQRPFLWAQKNNYFLDGERIAQLHTVRYGKPLNLEVFFDGKREIRPVNIDKMIRKNARTMDILVADAKRRAKELFDKDIKRCDCAYIACSGGKDSIALLDICDQVLPYTVPVVFSDTDMELPDTYAVWEQLKSQYPKREFIKASAEKSALENWNIFGPPSRAIRWCCSVQKSTPAVLLLKERLGKTAIRVMAFTGVRGEESYGRSGYLDASDGMKNSSQLNRMPLLDWSAHELWLYIYMNNLTINRAYRYGLPRVGCALCPEASEKYAWFVDRVYPGLLEPYGDIVIKTSNKSFATREDEIEFIASSNWQARKSGAVLNDPIQAPTEVVDGYTVTFESPNLQRERFMEWIKTLGNVTIDKDSGQKLLKLPHTLDDGIPFMFRNTFGDGGSVTFFFRDKAEMIVNQPKIRTCCKKSAACVGCRVCEAECSLGAMTAKNGRMVIDEDKCVHCLKCHEIDNACWRYKSMYKAADVSSMNGINRYSNFGLRERGKDQWISTAVEMRESFFPWNADHPLGGKMVDAASAWFQQALLFTPKSRKPSVLLDYFQKYGGEDQIGWEFIWIALANNATLVKWFIENTELNKKISVDDLADMMSSQYPSLGKSTIKGGLSALKDMLSKSPLSGDEAVTDLEMKGRSVIAITRKPVIAHPISLLYGMYIISHITDREIFTVREMLPSDDSSSFVSPIVAFGIEADTFKKQIEGLRSRFPDYIGSTFTHGNDEFQVYGKRHTPEEIVILAMEDK